MEHPPVAPAGTRVGIADKRAALLDAALELFASDGLQSVPTSAIARKAGVAKGTLFVYFETKEQLLNELYLDVASQYVRFMRSAFEPLTAPEACLRQFWFAFSRWHLDEGAAATFMLQCEVSSVLSPDTQAQKEDMEGEMVRLFFPNVGEWVDDSMARYVGYALVAGPIQVLVQMRDKGEIEVTDDLLEQTFARVEKALTS